jgi:hypothetical protein
MSCDYSTNHAATTIGFSDKFSRVISFNSADGFFAARKRGDVRDIAPREVFQLLSETPSTLILAEAERLLSELSKLFTNMGRADQRRVFGDGNPVLKVARLWGNYKYDDDWLDAAWGEVAHSPDFCDDAIRLAATDAVFQIPDKHQEKVWDKFLVNPALVLDMIANPPQSGAFSLNEKAMMHDAVWRGATAQEGLYAMFVAWETQKPSRPNLDFVTQKLLWDKMSEDPDVAERALAGMILYPKQRGEWASDHLYYEEDGPAFYPVCRSSNTGDSPRGNAFAAMATGRGRMFLEGFASGLNPSPDEIAALRRGIACAPCGFYDGYGIRTNLPDDIQALVRAHQEASEKWGNEYNDALTIDDAEETLARFPGMADKVVAHYERMDEKGQDTRISSVK